MSQNSSDWEVMLKGCDFIMARNEISRMFEIWQEEAKAQGGEYYIAQELNDALMPFMSDPRLETAINFLNVAPTFYSYFEACGPMGRFSLYSRILGEKYDDS